MKLHLNKILLKVKCFSNTLAILKTKACFLFLKTQTKKRYLQRRKKKAVEKSQRAEKSVKRHKKEQKQDTETRPLLGGRTVHTPRPVELETGKYKKNKAILHTAYASLARGKRNTHFHSHLHR